LEEMRNNLAIEFCGLRLENPFLLSSAPPAANGEMIKRAFEKGWAGAVTKTLKPDTLEVVDVTPRLAVLKDTRNKIVALGNIELVTTRPLTVWIQELKELKKAYPEKIIIASLMALTVKEEWQELALQVQDYVDALELNFSCPHGMPERGMGMAVGQDAAITGMITAWVKEVAKVPVIVKLTPNVTDIGSIARSARDNGADGITAINTVASLVGVDLGTLRPIPTVAGKGSWAGLSGTAIKPVGLRCVAQVAQAAGLPVFGVGGISTWQDAAEYLAVGARAVQVGTAVMLKGYDLIAPLKTGLAAYLAEKGFSSVEDLVGKALPHIVAHDDLDRQSRIVYQINSETCNKCQLCVTACRDGGYQAIAGGKDLVPVIAIEKCGGCSLCSHVCPVPGCITPRGSISKTFGRS